MKLNRKSMLSFIVALCFAVACQHEEEFAPLETTDFVAGELATVLIAKDHQVTFYEGAPGAIVVSELKSMEANQKASPEIQKILRGNSYVEMYQLLAGKAQDPSALKKLQAAELRYKERLANDKVIQFGDDALIRKYPRLANEGESARTAGIPHCDLGNFDGPEFYNNYVLYVPDGATYVEHQLNTRAFSGGLSTFSNTKYEIIISNGQDWGSNNVIGVTLPSLPFGGSVYPQWVMHYYMGPGLGGIFSYAFKNGLNCATTSYVIFWYYV